MKLAVPFVLFALIRNGLAMGQYCRRAFREDRKPAGPREADHPQYPTARAIRWRESRATSAAGPLPGATDSVSDQGAKTRQMYGNDSRVLRSKSGRSARRA